MHRVLAPALGVVLLAGLVSPATAQQGNQKKKADAAAAVQVSVGFTERQRTTITSYFAEHHVDVAPLPPGIAKNLARGKPLPPGIAKRRLPDALRADLPLRDGVEITLFGDRVVLLEASGTVVDILADVFK